MINKLFLILVALIISAVSFACVQNLFPTTKLHDPARKIVLAKQIRFLENEHREVAVLRQSVLTKTGDFADVDEGIYDEYVSLIEADYQNTTDQLAQVRREYDRLQ